MKKIRSSKLAIRSETIKALSTTRLERVMGGFDSAPGDNCPKMTLAQLPPPVVPG